MQRRVVIAGAARLPFARSHTAYAELDNLTAVWKATNDQDRRLVETTHAGVSSRAYQPGPYSPYTEGLVEAFCAWYVDRMRAGVQAER